MHTNEFEQQVQQKAGALTIKPSEGLWDKIEAQLPPQPKRKRPLLWLLALLLVVGGATIWLIKEQSSPPAFTTANKNVLEQKEVHHQATQKETINGASSARDTSIVQQNLIAAVPSNTKSTSSTVGKNKVSIRGNQTDNDVINANKPIQQNNPGRRQVNITVAATIEEDESNELGKPLIVAGNLITTQRATAYMDLQPVKKAMINEALLTKTQTLIPAKKKWEMGVTLGAGVSARVDNQSAYNSSSPLGAGSPGPVVNPSSGHYAKPKPGFTFAAGIYAERALDKRWILHTGLLYNYQSNRQPIGQPSLSNNLNLGSTNYAFGDSNSYKNQFHFLQIPLLFQYRLTPAGKWRVQGGVAVSYLLSSNTLVYNASRSGFSNQQQWLNPFNLSVQTGISYHLRSQSLGARMQYNMTSLVQKNIQTQRMLAVQLYYQLPLQKK